MTQKNTTVSPILTQSGKNIISDFFANPLEIHEEHKDAGCDLLALVCSLHRSGKKYRTIYEKIEKMANNDVFDEKYEQCDVDQADDIRKFYRQKIIMKRLGSAELTSFEQIVEWIVSNPTNHYKISHIRPMVKLPVFHAEDQKTRDLISKYTSVKENSEFTMDCVLNFVDNVEKDISMGKFVSWYYATPQNNLVKITTKINKDDTSYCLWKNISEKQKTIKIKADMIGVRIRGELFCAYEFKNTSDFQIDFV